MAAKSGREALADVSSTLNRLNSLVDRALAEASRLGARSAEAQQAATEARSAILTANEARLHAHYASTGTNPDIGAPLAKAQLASAADHAQNELDIARRQLGRTFGPG